MVGNHVADIVAKYGTSGGVPQALTDYIAGREGYDYNSHGKAGNTHTDFVPDEVIDRPKGYFPVPAITHLQGKVLDLVRDALSSAPARDRALFRPEYVQELLAEPNGELTPLRGNKLWQLGLLELWLQAHAA